MDFNSTTQTQKISILTQEVLRLKTQNDELLKQILNLVDATQKGFQILNEELTRIAKLP